MKRSPLTALVLLAPAVAMLVGLFAVPLAVLVRYSLYEARPGGVMIPAVVIENYRRFLSDWFYLRILWTTLGMGLWVTIVCLVLGYPVAYYLARTRSRGVRAMGITGLLIPLMTSVVVRSYGWMVIFFATQNTLSRLFEALGIPARFAQVVFTPRGVIIALAEVLLPFMVLSIMPVLQSIDPVLEEASHTLGAQPATTFRRIVLPLSMPGVVSGCILVFVLAINAFATPSLVGGSSMQVLSVFIYTQALALFNWPFGAAASIILLTLVLILTWGHDQVAAGGRRATLT